MQRGEAIVAREHELRFAGALDEAERLVIALERTRRVAVALVDLTEHDQRYREVVELTELTIQLDGGPRRFDALRLATVRQRAIGDGQIGVQARLHAEIAEALRGLETLEAGGDSPRRIERAVQDAEVRVAAAGGLQQALAERDLDAALDVGDRLSWMVRSRERHAKCIARVRDDLGRLAPSVRVAAVEGELFGQRKGTLRPFDRSLTVAASESEPAHLLIEVRRLDVGSAALEQCQASGEAFERPIPLGSLPVQSPQLPTETSLGAPVARLNEMRARGLVVLDGLGAPPECRQEVSQALSNRELLVPRTAFPKRAQRPLVVSERVLVGVHGTRAISRGQQEARATPTVGAQAEMMAERLDVLGSRLRARKALVRLPGPIVGFGPSRHE